MTKLTEHAMRKWDGMGEEDWLRFESERSRNGFGLRFKFGPELERQITEPHDREHGRPVVWLLWLYREDEEYTSIPQLSCVCTNEYSIRYHVGALIQQEEMSTSRPPLRSSRPEDWARWVDSLPFRFYVERAPVDHSFGSSMLRHAQEQMIFTPPIKVGQARKLPFGGD